MLTTNIRYIFILSAVALFSLLSVSYSSALQVLQPPSKIITESLFGMHIHRALSKERWPKVRFHGWRLWDAFVAWPDLEPSKGKWNFETLDQYVSLAEKNKVEILYPLGLSPTWASARQNEPSIYGKPGYAAEPKNLDDWKNYVRTIATRYKGRIHYYEIWNEPNLKGFYSGSVTQMVSLAREAHLILKEVDPSIQIVSPSATGGSNGPDWLDKYLAEGGGKYADVIGYHFYVTPSAPEAMVPLISRIKSITKDHSINKPLWNTEMGWSKNKIFANDDDSAAYVARSYILNWAAGVERFYWYAWDNKDWVGLRMTKDDYTLTGAATAFAEIQKWLIGAQMTSCSSGSNGIWTCGITRNGGYMGWIVWNSEKSVSFNIPKTWDVKQVRDLKGKAQFSKGVTKIEVGSSPVVLENLNP